MEATPVHYPLARRKIRDGDLLLFRPRRGLMGRLITAAGRSDYSHAAMAVWWNGRLMCLETVQFGGGRAVLLSNLVERHPGSFDVYAANATRRLMTDDIEECLTVVDATLPHLPAVVADMVRFQRLTGARPSEG